MKNRMTVFMAVLFMVVCLGAQGIYGETNVDPLWEKAVQLAAQNAEWIPGQIKLNGEEISHGKVETTQVKWFKTFLGEDGSVKTELAKSLENGEEVVNTNTEGSSDGAKTKKDRENVIELQDFTRPFLPSNQKTISIKKQAQLEEVKGQSCVVYKFKFTTEKGRYSGSAWITEAGIPVKAKYTINPAPITSFQGVKAVTYLAQYNYESEDKWVTDTGAIEVRYKNKGMFARSELTFDEFWRFTVPSPKEILTQAKTIGKVETCDVPFEYWGNHIYVKVRLNDEDKERVFLLDTGAGVTIIEPEVYKTLGLKKLATMGNSDGYITKVTDVTSLNRIQLGELTVENCGVNVFDLKKVESFTRDIDGILGANFLKLFNVKIDYQSRNLTFATNPIVPERVAKIYKIPLGQEWPGLIFTDMKFPGVKETLKVEIDTGSGSQLIVPKGFVKQIKPEVECKPVESKGIAGGGAFGGSEEMITRIEEYQIGEYSSANLLTRLSGHNLKFAILGNEFLSQFTVILNYANDEMVLIPNPKQKFATNIYTYGFVAKDDEQGKNRVSVIWEGSGADRAGLQVGDEIIKAEAQKKTFTTPDEINGLVHRYDLIRLYIKRASGETDMYLWKEPLLPEVKEAKNL